MPTAPQNSYPTASNSAAELITRAEEANCSPAPSQLIPLPPSTAPVLPHHPGPRLPSSVPVTLLLVPACPKLLPNQSRFPSSSANVPFRLPRLRSRPAPPARGRCQHLSLSSSLQQIPTWAGESTPRSGFKPLLQNRRSPELTAVLNTEKIVPLFSYYFWHYFLTYFWKQVTHSE